MQTLHSPTPWRISDDGQRLIDATGEAVIALFYGAAVPDQVGAVNIALAHRAVNSHAALLAACQTALDWLDDCKPGTQQTEIAAELKAALALAKGAK